MDRPIATSTCLINQPMSSAPPCAEPIINYTQTQLSHIYIALFVSLAVEILALCNALTLFCNMNNKLEPEPKFHLENASANTLVGSGDLKKHIPQY
jgi:hypothetical protein